jgi:hypothetical protein
VGYVVLYKENTFTHVGFDALLYASNGCPKHVLFTEERKKEKGEEPIN